MKKIAVVTALLAVLALSATAAVAEDLKDVLPGLVDIELFNNGNGHEAHFHNDKSGDETIGALNLAIASQFATYPLGSSSGGVIFSVDPSLGVQGRTSKTLGSQFGERSLCLGKSKWNWGVRYLHSSVDSIDGIETDSGDLVIQLRHKDQGTSGPTSPYWQGDLIQVRFKLDLNLDTALFFANYGVTDRFDVGVAIPVVRADLDVRTDETINDQATAGGPTFHCFEPNCGPTRTVHVSDSATGVGDIVLRAKYNFYQVKEFGLAGALDLRVPTGSEEDFLGTGSTQAKLFVIGAAELGRFSPYANLGYTVSSGDSNLGGEIPDEIDYTAGVNVAVHRNWTVFGDAIGRILKDAPRVNVLDKHYRHVTFADQNTVLVATEPTMQTSTSDVHSLVGAVGAKYNPKGGVLISAGVLLPVSDDGLKNNIAFVAGVDWTF